MMRLITVTLLALTATTAAASAQADPYRWCAHYGGEDGGGNNCYFMTLEQCRWAISGNGGYCGPNPFYTGPATERPAPQRRSKKTAG
jgi:hypothetical protein